jgi:Kelch motif protein
MNERSRLSDEQITDLLRRRSARPAPDALTSAVLESLASERARHPVWATGRPAKRPLVLLAAAALLLVGGALAAGSGLLRLPAVVPPVPAPSLGPLAVASPDATTPSPSDLARPSASPIPAAGPGGQWIRTGSLITPRADNVAVRLADGRVLVAGGTASDGSDLTSAELYDPVTGTWSATGSMIHRADGGATLLADGRVLVVDAINDSSHGAELYDPATGTWSATGMPSDGGHAILLRDGRVLHFVGPNNGAQLYDPATGTWTATGKMVVRPYNVAAVLLSDGRVLVAGGDLCDSCPIKSAELYDPQTDSWTATADMPEPGFGMQATLLEDGTVLFVHADGRTTLYDPSTGTWKVAAKPPTGHVYVALTRLLDGTVLAVGIATSPAGDTSNVADLYDPATGSWTAAASMLPSSSSDYPSRTTLLLDGTVLVEGGYGCASVQGCPNGPDTALAMAQLYIPAGVVPPTGLTPLPSPVPTPVPTPAPTPFPPMAGPVPQSARPWEVRVENKSSKAVTLFLAREPLTDMSQLCGSVTPDVVPAHTTKTVTFQLPPKSVNDCWLMVLPGPGADGGHGPTNEWPIPGRLVIQDGGDNANGDDLSTVWVGP